MKITKSIGLIGVGNMGTAILEGLLKKKLITASQVAVYDKIPDKAAAFSKQWKTRKALSNSKLVKQSDIVILAVKPQDLQQTAEEITSVWKKSHVLISILAGMPVAKIRKAVWGMPQVVRAMPNLGAKVGASITAITGESKTALSAAENVFLGCGTVIRLPEGHFDLVTALSGSGPAYFFLLMEMMAAEGVKKGLTQEQAVLLAVQTAVGAGLLAQASLNSPAELRAMVTSKGGTTEAALKVMEKNNIRKIFSEAIAAAHRRGAELSQS